MILVVCLPCAYAIRVMANVTDVLSATEVEQLVGRRSDFWPDRFPCVRCGKHAQGMREAEADPRVVEALELQDLTAQQAFAAFYGMGLPDEQRCSLESVQALLLENPVRKVHGKNVIGAERAIIDALELWDGTKLYFGAGAEGAVIYRTTRPVSYTAKALKENNDG